MFEYFISKRYLRSKHRFNIISIISLFSTIGVTIGVAALVIVLSVFNGFGSLVTSMLVNFDPHLRITLESSKTGNSNLKNMKEYLDNSNMVKSYSPYIDGKVILIKNKATEIMNIKGVDSDNIENAQRLNSRITFGEYELESENNVGKIILSLPIALRLSVRVGDTLFATSANQIKNMITRMSLPNTKRLEVTGIYEISNKEYALSYCFTSLNVARDILNMGNKSTGLEVVLEDIDESENMKNEILANFQGVKISTWYDLHKDLYRVMLIERWAAYILLSLIIAVAAFNILSSLTMSVLEKKKDIGVLRSMGATQNSIKKIFMFEGLLVGFIGTIIGLIMGLFVCYLQINYNIYPLDASKYVIDTLPVQVKISDIFAVSIMSFLLTFFASRYPAKRALKTKVIDAIKWE